jgi:hypothetical protein
MLGDTERPLKPLEAGMCAIQRQFLRAPTTSQIDLLTAIWEPFRDGQGWPVWDYVARTLYRRNEQVELEHLWASLPKVPPTHLQQLEYGPVWTDSQSRFSPRLEARVGLSIAGLNDLRWTDPQAGKIADGLAKLVGYMASWERELIPDVDQVVTLEHRLDQRIWQPLVGESGLHLGARSLLGLLQVLQHERAPIHLTVDGVDGMGVVTLRTFLAPFLGVTSADGYLDILEGEAAPTRPSPQPAAGLDFAHALDHLALVLAADDAWVQGPLVGALDLRSPGVVAMDVTNEADFQRGLSALAVLLGGLNTPLIPESEVKQFGGTQPGSLSRFGFWLGRRLSDAGARERADAAVKDLIAINRLRVDGQHVGEDIRKKASQARRSLGLPDPIYDWSAAWLIVRGRVVEALLTISQALRTDGAGDAS